MLVFRIGAVAGSVLCASAHAQSPPAEGRSPLAETAVAFSMEGAHSWGEPGIDGPTLGIDRTMLAWVMSDFYPLASLKAKEEGETTVLACVDANGKVVKTGLSKSSGFTRLDAAALAMMAAVPMKPSTLNGKAVLFCPYAMSVTWRLPGSAPPAPQRPGAPPHS